jgi:hypothetical protein
MYWHITKRGEGTAAEKYPFRNEIQQFRRETKVVIVSRCSESGRTPVC